MTLVSREPWTSAATPRKPVIGIVGGIGAGKSTAAAAFARRGGYIVHADALGHEALRRPEVIQKLVARWGESVLNPDGTPNRRAVARIVFRDPLERQVLESLVFPHIGDAVREEIAKGSADPAVRFVVLDAAVMLEAGWDGGCDHIIYVQARRDVRLARLAARSGWNPDQVAEREAAQMPANEKVARADVVVTNDGTAEQLQDQVDGLLAAWGL